MAYIKKKYYQALNKNKRKQVGVGEIVQPLKTLVTLAEDLRSVPSAHMVAHNQPITSIQGDLTPLSTLGRQ